MIQHCRLCQTICQLPGSRKSPYPWDQVLLETHNFVAAPTLGAIVEGWLLLVPKRHCLSVGTLPEAYRTELMRLKDELWSVLEEAYGPVAAFEHGSSSQN